MTKRRILRLIASVTALVLFAENVLSVCGIV